MATTTFEIERTSRVRRALGTGLPYVILTLSIIPIMVGYAWVVIATFSQRTHGLLPVDSQGNFGGLTLANWTFLADSEIWFATARTFGVAIFVVIGVGFVATLTGYAISRMNFSGRRGFLGLTLALHAFRPEMLLIAIFFVLLYIAGIPVLGDAIGFNTVGGVALVMIALELPLGIWIMKGFFDKIPWDMERAALIDGASRFRVWREILVPQIKPGLAALAIFMFITGWNAFLIPFTFTIGAKASTLPVYLEQFSTDTAFVSWNSVAAIGLFSMVPVTIFFIFTQEALLNIYGGGTKGGT